MVRLGRWFQYPLLQILTSYTAWQSLSLAIYWSFQWTRLPLFALRPVAFMLPVAISTGASLAVCLTMMRLINRRTFASFGFTLPGCVTGFVLGLLLGLLAYAGYVGIFWIGGWYHVVGINHNFHFRYVLFYYFLVAIGEETLFRGYILQVLEGRWGTKAAILTSSFLFGLVHIVNDGTSRWQSGHILDWVIQPVLSGFVGGILFSGAFLLTRRIWIPIGLHCAWDTAAAVFFDNPFGIASFYQNTINVHAYQITGVAFWMLTFFIAAFALVLLKVGIKRGNWRESFRALDKVQLAR